MHVYTFLSYFKIIVILLAKLNQPIQDKSSFTYMFFKKKRKYHNIATKLYLNIIEQSRNDIFYQKLSINDTIEKRFEMITLHMFIVMQQLKNSNSKEKEQLSQSLFDTMFENMEIALREQGIGDMGIPKRMKKLINIFYDRVLSYDNASSNNDFSKEINKFLYDSKNIDNSQIISKYMAKQINILKKQNMLLAGDISWIEFS